MAHGWEKYFSDQRKKKKERRYLSVWRQAVCVVLISSKFLKFRHKNRMHCVNCVGCSWSRPNGAYRISLGGHLSSGFYPCPLTSLSFSSSCDANFVVSCSSTSGPSDSNPEPSSNRSYSRRWHNPLPRRRHPDQMPSSRIVRDWIDSDTSPLSQGSI